MLLVFLKTCHIVFTAHLLLSLRLLFYVTGLGWIIVEFFCYKW